MPARLPTRLARADANLIAARLEHQPMIDAKPARLDARERFGPKREIELRPCRPLRLPFWLMPKNDNSMVFVDQPAAVLRREGSARRRTRWPARPTPLSACCLNGAACTVKVSPLCCSGALSASRSSGDVLFTVPRLASRARRALRRASVPPACARAAMHIRGAPRRAAPGA